MAELAALELTVIFEEPPDSGTLALRLAGAAGAVRIPELVLLWFPTPAELEPDTR